MAFHSQVIISLRFGTIQKPWLGRCRSVTPTNIVSRHGSVSECDCLPPGLSDWSLLTTYGKLCILIFAAWGGEEGGIIAGLCVCTIMQTIVGMCADLMQDFKTGHYVSLFPHPHPLLHEGHIGILPSSHVER